MNTTPLKFVAVGDGAVGKTTLLIRFGRAESACDQNGGLAMRD